MVISFVKPWIHRKILHKLLINLLVEHGLLVFFQVVYSVATTAATTPQLDLLVILLLLPLSILVCADTLKALV